MKTIVEIEHTENITNEGIKLALDSLCGDNITIRKLPEQPDQRNGCRNCGNFRCSFSMKCNEDSTELSENNPCQYWQPILGNAKRNCHCQSTDASECIKLFDPHGDNIHRICPCYCHTHPIPGKVDDEKSAIPEINDIDEAEEKSCENCSKRPCSRTSDYGSKGCPDWQFLFPVALTTETKIPFEKQIGFKMHEGTGNPVEKKDD